MIRRLTVLILLVSASASMAQPLYKWVESDGSITFSPSKPPAGVEFEKIEGVQAASELTGTPPTEGTTPAIRTTGPATVSVSDPATQARVQPRVQPRVQYAPTNSEESSAAMGADRKNDLSATTDQLRDVTPPTVATPANAQPRATPANVSNKQRRCEDLRKRVVSLERRLTSRLTPEDMDNTVVHMARYQRSFDQHCVQ